MLSTFLTFTPDFAGGGEVTSGGSRISPRRGRQLPSGGCQHMILPKFPKNCMKLKEFRPPGGRASKILLCRSATGYSKLSSNHLFSRFVPCFILGLIIYLFVINSELVTALESNTHRGAMHFSSFF